MEGDPVMRKEYDTFVLKELSDVLEDEETELTLRDLSPGIYKYKQIFVRAVVSKDPNKYPDILWVRLGKGQLLPDPWSVKIIERVSMIQG